MRPISEQDHVKQKDSLIDQMIDKIRDAYSSVSGNITKKYIRLHIEVSNKDPLQWLLVQKQYPSIYWSDRQNQLEVAGIGSADSKCRFHNFNFDRCNTDLKYFTGFRFDETVKENDNWGKMAQAQFILPRFELVRAGSLTEFVCNLVYPDDLDKMDEIVKQLYCLQFDSLNYVFDIPKLLNRTDNPDKVKWKANVRKILNLINSGKIEKLVSARESVFEFTKNLNPVGILSELKKVSDGCFHFCFQPTEDYAFIGASPERLYYRNKRQIFSEALAGTRPRGKNAEEDTRLGRELLNSDKDIREHRFVSDSIKSNFNSFCSKVRTNKELTLMKLRQVQHLMIGIEGELEKKISDQEIIESLHPTPAVGGYPQKESIVLIAEIESFDRGWYSGPIGWVSKDEADFAVAIRSGLVVKNKLHIYSGAGIVKGSDPSNEWNEIESKIATFLKVLS